jgi:hypothetical protein
MAHRTQGRTVSRSRRRGRAGSDPSADVAAARRELETIDRGLRAITERIEHHERRQAARQAFFAEHAAEAERRDVLCRAERAREVQVRAGALARVPRELELLLGPRPSPRDACLVWESAAQEFAVYRERYGPRSPGSATDPLIEILGKRPMPGPARRSYDRALAAIEAAAQPSLPKSPEAELLVT